MDYNRSNEISVSLELFNLLHSIIVKDPNEEIIRPTYNPLFLMHKSNSSYWINRSLNSSDAYL